jgi:amino acid adenylation domain-containing protein
MTILSKQSQNLFGEPKSDGTGSDQPNADAAPLSSSELQKVLYTWNQTQAEFPNVCVHELFEQQVSRTPDAVAVIFQDRQLTYLELNLRANQVAHYLRKRGVGPEALVGVCLERSPKMVIALLGVWKAGGAYVPIDPAYPAERLSFMVSDSEVRVLLTDQKCKGLFPSSADRAVCLDSDWPAIAQENTGNPDSGAKPSNLAYIIYTSGSTGKPKGAMILHRGLVNYLWWAIRAYAVETGGSVPVHSSISFDLTVTSLYPALLAGGKVELLPEDVGAQNLLAALRSARNRSLVKITPAHLELISQQLSPAEAAGMTRTFVIGGENLLAESLRLWRESAPGTRLINEYGPTETVVGCCVYEVQPQDPGNGAIPIGRPIANTQLYVLDSNLQPVAPGVMGELYIGGAGVARGYLNRPELTQERFLPDPFSRESEARLYKTGDLARYRADGILEYLGRTDNQVKVRGYRIELGEIEATLAGHPDVQSCAVLAREDEPGTKQLVGYVVPREEPPTVEALQTFLKERLPEYMAPARFVFLDSFPLTPNGKVDRKALPAPSHEDVATAREYVAPRTEVQKSLAAIWAELLKLERVGIHDDFFELGGHSLMAMRVLSQVRDAFGVDLPLATLLEAPTIDALSKFLDKEAPPAPSWSLLVPMRPDGTKPPLFLMHAHGGNVLEYHALVHHLDPDQPVYAFQAKGLNGDAVKDTSVEKMAAAFIEELRAFQPEGPYYLGGFCLGGLLALEMALQLTAAGQEVALVAVIQSIYPASMQFKPSTSAIQRCWYRAAKRIDLELENFSSVGKDYAVERGKHLLNRVRVRIAMAFNGRTGREPLKSSPLSQLYIFETLGIEHKKAMQKYSPNHYQGDVALFRASKQLSGLIAEGDEYLGWKQVLHGKLEVCEVPGHQQNLLLEPNVSRLAQELSTQLKAAQKRHQANKITQSVALPWKGPQ